MPEDFIQSPPDSTGKRVHTKMVNDGTNDVYTPIHMLADRTDPTLRQSVNNEGAAKVTFAGGSPDFDAFGRTTVSEPNLIGMYKFYHREYADDFEETIAGAGVISRDVTLKGMKAECGTGATDKAFYQSHRHFHYRPANSMSLIFTMNMGDTGKTNVTRWAGWRTDIDGIYFELVDSVFNAVIENGNTGVTTRIPITAWSHDRLDGGGGSNNLSGATIDLSKTAIWWIDFQFLGSGAVRFGTFVNGKKVVCHVEGNYGVLDRPYLSSPSLSLGFGQENTGIVGSSSEMHVSCVVVTNDGYDEFDRRPIAISASKTLTTTSFVPVLSFKPTATFHAMDNRARILPQIISILAEGGSIELIATVATGADLTGATWGNIISGTEYDIGSSALSGGETKVGFFIASGRSESIDLSSVFKINLDGVVRHYTPATSDIITISARLISAGSATAAISLNVIEIE